jgi:predicted RNA-binding protein with TRAM domain
MSYSSSNRESRFDLKPPVEVGQEYEGEIEDISRRGDGIAKIEGFVIFVANTKKGEHVKFRITQVGRRFAVAELV